MTTELLKTPLYSRHVQLGAKIVPFAGYLMPVSYAGIREEHISVRTKAGLFDTSHMGMFRITGTGAPAWLARVTVSAVAALEVGGAQYSALCYENGTLVDDIYLLRPEAGLWLMVVNASNKAKDFSWLQGLLDDGVTLEDLSPGMGILALQGPEAVGLTAGLLGAGISQLTHNGSGVFSFLGSPLVVSRTGYTGEDGCEFYPSLAQLPALWDALLQAGAAPVGLGARDTLRLEAGFSLYGHELDDRTTLLESSLAWVASWDKGDFIGRAALEEQRQAGVPRRVVGLKAIDKCIPREGYSVYSGDLMVGKITSGGVVPTTGEGIAMASISQGYNKIGTALQVEIRGVRKAFEVTNRRLLKKNAA